MLGVSVSVSVGVCVGVGGGGLWVKSDFSVSLRPFFQRSEIEMDTELNNNSRNTFCADHWS